MYIKKLIISGFKSYKDEVQITDFHQGFNVIVGRNGSGKSNLFSAIQLVLTEDFNKLNPTARTALLHMGKPKHDAAYIEVIFDNTNKLLPFEDDEVSFKRYVGGKKDRYYINGNTVSDFRSYLEVAGFVNPYFFVKQGSVTEIATATNAARLNIIKEISGSRVWDESKVINIKCLGSVDVKLKKLQEIVSNIHSVRNNLQEEEGKLHEVLELEKNKRAYEYLILDRDVKIFLQRINEYDNKRRSLLEDIQPVKDEIVQVSTDLKSQRESTNAVVQKKKKLLEEKFSLVVHVEEAIKFKSKERNYLRDLLHEMDNLEKGKTEMEEELKRIIMEEAKLKFELKSLLPKYKICKENENVMAEIYSKVKTISDQNKTKFGLVSRFPKGTGDNEFRTGLQEIQAELNNKFKVLEGSQAKLVEIDRELNGFNTSLKKMKVDLTMSNNERIELESSLIEVRKAIMVKENQRSEVLDKDARIEEKLRSHREALRNLTGNLYKIAGRAKAAAWISVEICLREMQTAGGKDNVIAKYYGQVIENITCDSKYWPAVATCAGEKLFFHIVETNSVGLTIMKEFNRLKLHGELVFISLDTIYVPDLVQVDETDIVTIRNNLKYSPRVRKAVEFVFGNKLLCRSLETAVRASKEYRTTAVTLDGDKVSNLGPITGGYLDNSNSALGIQNERSAELVKIAECESQMQEIQSHLQKIDSDFQEKNKGNEKSETKLARLLSIIDNQNMGIRFCLERIRFKQEEKVQESRNVDKLEKAHAELKRQIDQLQVELNQMKSGKDNGNQLDASTIRVLKENRKQNVEASEKSRESYKQLRELEAKKNKLESNIRNMAEKKTELEISLESSSNRLTKMKMEETKQKVKTMMSNINRDLLTIKNFEETVSKTENELQTLKSLVAETETKEKELLDIISRQKWDLDNLILQQNLVNQKLKECELKIQSIGTFPNLVPSFEKLKTKSIVKKLREVNIRLNKMPSVNRFAGELVKYAERAVDEIKDKATDARKGLVEVINLVEYIDGEKSSVVLNTCRALQVSFRQIFSKLVPEGAAEMVLTNSTGDFEFTELTVFDTPSTANIRAAWDNEEFNGLALRVRFSGDYSLPCVDLQRFSGGQKSIVALAMILALQKCDPVSLYLFDEVDQALDPVYRNSVAKALQEMSTDVQFICTTFRREFLDFANQFYGVYFRNQSSKVKIVTREEAHDFIDDSVADTSGSVSGDSDDVKQIQQGLFRIGDGISDLSKSLQNTPTRSCANDGNFNNSPCLTPSRSQLQDQYGDDYITSGANSPTVSWSPSFSHQSPEVSLNFAGGSLGSNVQSLQSLSNNEADWNPSINGQSPQIYQSDNTSLSRQNRKVSNLSFNHQSPEEPQYSEAMSPSSNRQNPLIYQIGESRSTSFSHQSREGSPDRENKNSGSKFSLRSPADSARSPTFSLSRQRPLISPSGESRNTNISFNRQSPEEPPYSEAMSPNSNRQNPLIYQTGESRSTSFNRQSREGSPDRENNNSVSKFSLRSPEDSARSPTFSLSRQRPLISPSGESRNTNISFNRQSPEEPPYSEAMSPSSNRQNPLIYQTGENRSTSFNRQSREGSSDRENKNPVSKFSLRSPADSARSPTFSLSRQRPLISPSGESRSTNFSFSPQSPPISERVESWNNNFRFSRQSRPISPSCESRNTDFSISHQSSQVSRNRRRSSRFNRRNPLISPSGESESTNFSLGRRSLHFSSNGDSSPVSSNRGSSQISSSSDRSPSPTGPSESDLFSEMDMGHY